MRGRDLTDFERGMIFALKFHAHWKSTRISQAIDKSFSTVRKFCQRQEGNAMINLLQGSQRKACGRRRLTSALFDKQVRRYSFRNRFASAYAIAHNFRNDTSVSHDTINRRLNEKGIRARKPSNKPFLTENHKMRRLTWARIHLNFDWHNVAFSDEKTFVITGSNAQFMRRKSNERYKECCVIKITNRSKGSCNVWGSFSLNGFTNLIKIESKMNSQKYTTVLQNNLLPFLNEHEQVSHFQQDNCPIHISNISRRWFQDHNVTLLPWPAISPDANPLKMFGQKLISV